jgi:ActR/RegA family two-component response regulator
MTELMARHGNNVSRAAEAAGVPRQTLHRILSRQAMR